MDYSELVKAAHDIKVNSYSPYSEFRVGAALLTVNNKIYTGVNIENASLGASNCAERTAVFKAVSEGERKIKALAVASDSSDFIYPCGICRQVIKEFAAHGMKVICSNNKHEYEVYDIGELLPHGEIPLAKTIST